MTPLMTWGSIEDTPLKVDDVMATPGPQFKLPKISRREEIGLKLSEKASKATSEKRKAALQHATSSILKSRWITEQVLSTAYKINSSKISCMDVIFSL